jgi:hypothetical protein
MELRIQLYFELRVKSEVKHGVRSFAQSKDSSFEFSFSKETRSKSSNTYG